VHLPKAATGANLPWWQQRGPSIAVLVGFLTVMGLATLFAVQRVGSALPEVGKDQLGEDNWSAPLGMHLGGGFNVARVPDCAAGAFTRIVLWDPDSQPYWEVTGPPTPLTSFVIGLPPKGFKTVTPYRDPPRGATLRLVAFRRHDGPVGLRYKATDLRTNRVVSLNPLERFTIAGFQSAEVCGGSTEKPTDNEAKAAAEGVDATAGG